MKKILLSDRRRSALSGAVLLAVFTSSCVENFAKPADTAQIVCKDNTQCPDGWVCNATIGQCVKVDKIDSTAPALTGDAVLEPTLLKKDSVALLSFTVNEELSVDPEVTLKLGNNTRPLVLNKVKSSGKTYYYSYTAAGDEPELSDCPVTITLVDNYGNRSGGISGNLLRFDFTAPKMLDSAITGTPAKKGGVVTVTFNVNEALNADPVVTFADAVPVVGAGSPRPEWASRPKTMNPSKGAGTAPLRFEKSPESSGLKYVYTYTAFGIESQDPAGLGINIAMADAAGNESSATTESKAVFDFIKPALSGDVAVDPQIATRGGYINVTFAVTEDLGSDPVVTIGGEAMVKEGKAGKTYTYSRRVTNSDPAGLMPVAISLSDVAGNTADNLQGPSVLYDFTGPKITDALLLPGWKLRANVYFKLSFNVDKTLGSDPEIVITNSLDPNVPLTRSATCAKTYCFDGKTPASGQAMFYSVNIKATDRAGNFTTANVGTMEIDNIAPKLAGFEVSPRTAKAGATITLVLSADEALAAAPAIVAYNMADPTKKLAFTSPDAAKRQTSYAYSATVVPGTVDGDYKFETFKLLDAAENESAEITRTEKLEVKATVPAIVEGPTLNKTPAYYKSGDKVMVSFKTNVSLDDSLPKARLAVKRNGQYLPLITCVKTTGVEKGYECVVADPLDGTETPQGINGIAIELADTAGNTSYASASLTMDFDAPNIAAGAYSNLISNFPENPIISVTALTNGTTVVANFSVSEELAADSPAPYIVICKTDGCAPKDSGQVVALTLDQSGSVGKSYRFTGKITTLASNLDFTSKIYLVPGSSGGIKDLAGNEQTAAVQVSTVKVNTTQPSTPSIANVYYRRVPWGERDANKNFVEKNFTVVCNACQFGTNVEKVLIYDSSTPTSGGLIGEAPNPHTGSAWSFEKIKLNGSDRAHVWMATADSAGNISPATEIKSAEWVATMGYKVQGSIWENPHTFLTNGLFSSTLNQFGNVQEPVVFEKNSQKHVRVNQIGQGIWNERGYSAACPSARGSHAMAYDSARGKIVLFGGYTSSGENDETWEWDGKSWTQLSPLSKPSIREGHAMVYDSARGKVVLFGGYPDDNETWEWDGTNWTQLNPVTRPSTRYYHAMAYDSARGKVVMFGGVRESYYDETWEWDGTDWTQLNPVTKPSARFGHAMAYDSARGKVVVFGGDAISSKNETWEWDGMNWAQLSPATKPSAGTYPAMAYDNAKGKVLLFGGTSGGNMTWEWDGMNWTLLSPVTKPSGRFRHAMAYDSARGKVVMFGGDTGSRSDETWEWDGTNWTQLRPTVKPSARNRHAMAFDSARGKVVMFGGVTVSYNNDETWEWDGMNWTQLNPATRPSARRFHAMAYNSTRGKVVLFGGITGFANDETWEWNGTNWTRLNPVTRPSARFYHAMACDSVRGKVVLFGGCIDSNPCFNNETWEWDGINWTQLNPATKPSARHIHAMVYDSVRGKLVMFGGETGTHIYSNETWTWDGTNWTQLSPATNPSASHYHAMSYESTRGKVVMFGGANDLKLINETWEWNGLDWTQLRPTVKPSARQEHAMAFDSARGKVVMFGGSSGGNETWEWDGAANERAGQNVEIAALATDVIGESATAQLTQLTAKFFSGGIGYPQGVVTNGVNLMAWYDNEWHTVASNGDGPKAPGLVEWDTSDEKMIWKMLYSGGMNFNFAVVPQAPNGFGHLNCPSDWTAEECDMGMVSTEYVEVTLKYTLP